MDGNIKITLKYKCINCNGQFNSDYHQRFPTCSENCYWTIANGQIANYMAEREEKIEADRKRREEEMIK